MNPFRGIYVYRSPASTIFWTWFYQDGAGYVHYPPIHKRSSAHFTYVGALAAALWYKLTT